MSAHISIYFQCGVPIVTTRSSKRNSHEVVTVQVFRTLTQPLGSVFGSWKRSSSDPIWSVFGLKGGGSAEIDPKWQWPWNSGLYRDDLLCWVREPWRCVVEFSNHWCLTEERPTIHAWATVRRKKCLLRRKKPQIDPDSRWAEPSDSTSWVDRDRPHLWDATAVVPPAYIWSSSYGTSAKWPLRKRRYRFQISPSQLSSMWSCRTPPPAATDSFSTQRCCIFMIAARLVVFLISGAAGVQESLWRQRIRYCYRSRLARFSSSQWGRGWSFGMSRHLLSISSLFFTLQPPSGFHFPSHFNTFYMQQNNKRSQTSCKYSIDGHSSTL